MKTESYFRNGPLHNRQAEVIPKGKRLHWCEVVRCWILVDKSLTKREAKAKEHAFTERYQEDEWKFVFKYI
jgi:hypothetical protein